MNKNNICLQQIRREYVDINFDDLYAYAKTRPWAKIENNHCIVPMDNEIISFLIRCELYNPSCNYLMLIDKTEELKEET